MTTTKEQTETMLRILAKQMLCLPLTQREEAYLTLYGCATAAQSEASNESNS